MRISHLSAAALFSSIVLTTLACGGGDKGTTNPNGIAVTIASSSQSIIVGQMLQLNATVTGADETGVTWSTSSASVATVSSTGLVTGVAAGTATITARTVADPAIKATRQVTVTAAPAGSGTLLTSGVEVVGVAGAVGSEKLYRIVVPAGATGLSVTTTGGTGDVDMKVRFNTPPTATGTANCSSNATGNVESCSISAPTQGTWYILLIGYEAYSGVTLKATVTVPAPPAPFAVAQLNGGYDFACALNSAGKAYCWGWNTDGQVGNGDHVDQLKPVAVLGGLTFTSIDAGGLNTCGLVASGAAYCWGDNSQAQLGIGTNTGESLTPVAVSGGLSFVEISVGILSPSSGSHLCARTSAGVLYCWGSNSYGQLGTGNYSQQKAPAQVSGGLTFSDVATGSMHTCGLTTAGKAYCWGDNYGQLGDGTKTDRIVPTAVSTALTFASITAGSHHTCALTSAGVAYCWGENSVGQLGDGTGTERLTPAAVSGGLTFTRLVAGVSHTCGLIASGAAYCWGYNAGGQLGDGTSFTNRLVPTAVVGGIAFKEIAPGSLSSCGIATNSNAYCWGSNGLGQVGDQTRTSRFTPTLVQAP